VVSRVEILQPGLGVEALVEVALAGGDDGAVGGQWLAIGAVVAPSMS
jgi:hypothetical protein